MCYFCHPNVGKITLNKRITYKIEQCSVKLEDQLQLISKDEDIELVCYISEQFCQTGFSVPQEKYKLTFQLNKDYINSFGNEDISFPNFIEKELCCTSKLIVFEILKANYNGYLKNMFIESKAIELFLCVIGCETAVDDKCSSCKFLMNSYEKEKIYAARDILLNNLENPPIISELALQVGINQCYLKKGFKDIFNTTAYAFVQEQRINKAKLLLKSTHNSIAEIAELVGFSNQSNFTNAFKNYTGVSPNELRNN
jgi:AraC-like DNA-binding protein